VEWDKLSMFSQTCIKSCVYDPGFCTFKVGQTHLELISIHTWLFGYV